MTGPDGAKTVTDRLRTLLLGAIALSMLATPDLATPSRAAAQDVEVSGPLAGAPAVRRMRLYREERFQLIVPAVGYTLQDEFARSIMVGLEANYHFLDVLGVGIYGAMANFGNAFQIDTDLTSQIAQNGQTTDRNRVSMPSPEGFPDQVARLQGLISAHLLFSPLRGKLSLFQGLFVDTDFYVLGGIAAVFLQERADLSIDAANACLGTDGCVGSQSARQDRVAIAPMLGVGLNLYFNEMFGLAIQWRAFPFDMNPSGTDEAGAAVEASVSIPDGAIDGQDQRFYFHHMVNIGLIINLPPEARLTE